MKHNLIVIIVLFICISSFATAPSRKEVYVEGGRFHVQGIAYDAAKECMYMSFTSAFFKTDMDGGIIASVGGINGHLGAMTFDPVSRKVYASLEMKDDEIGRNISDKLGVEAHTREESRFYVAVIDVDKLIGLNMKQEEVMDLLLVDEACADYKANVTVAGKEIDHRYACSGIDGITIGPAFGKSSRTRYLYVAYGIYGDVNRTDNDYNILLAYPLKKVEKAYRRHAASLPPLCGKYFIHTGNTTWGVQNLAYDKSIDKMFLAVYKGKKPEHPNYTLFAVNMNGKPYKGKLEGVPYEERPVLQMDVANAWHYKWGSTGLCPLGDGLFYISENGRAGGQNFCRARLMRYTGAKDSTFVQVK